MEKRLVLWELAGLLFTAALGTALHFTYALSGGSTAAAVFSAVNESTWEHMKLFFFPMLLLSLLQLGPLGRNYPNFPAVRGLSAVLGTVLIPVLFYTYTGVLGRHFLAADIAVFLLSAAGAFWLDRQLLSAGRFSAGWQQVAGLVLLWGLAFLFVWFTFYPPELALFRDPVTGGFGLVG